MKFYNIILVLECIIQCQAKWKLKWFDEFEDKILNKNKWEALNEINSCHGNYIEQLNCNTNSSNNIRLIDGSLVITAIHEKHLNKNFTSGQIITKESFTFGKFEIRAALSKGKLLRPAMVLNPEKVENNWPKGGEIDIVINAQTPYIANGLHYGVGLNKVFQGIDFEANTSLNLFNVYSIEWTQSEIRWFFNDYKYHSFNINTILDPIYQNNGQPFDKPFRLYISLGIGGNIRGVKDQTLSLSDVYNWECSLLIVDYVRIYESTDSTETINENTNNTSADKQRPKRICDAIMPKIRIEKPFEEKNISLTPIISSISVVLLLVLIPLVIYLFVRQQKLANIKGTKIKSINENEYYDDIESKGLYDTPGYEIASGYETIEPGAHINPEIPVYLEMTNRNK